MLAIPGLINTHTHAGMNMLRGYADDMSLMDWLENKIWPAESQLTPEDIRIGSRFAILEMLKNGITGFNDMYFAMELVADEVKKSGIRAQLGYGLIEENDGQEGLEKSDDFIYRNHNDANGRLTCNIAPHSPYTCSSEFLKGAMKIADKYDINIHTHVAETEGEVQDLVDSEGRTPVEYLHSLGFFEQHVLAVHSVHLNDDEIDILAEKDVSISHNPTSNAKLASGIAPVKKMLAEGINVTLGTDGAASNNRLDLISEARMASYLQKVKTSNAATLNTRDLLAMMTENAAEALNWILLGKIKSGYKADIVLIDKKSRPEFYPDYDSLSNLLYASKLESVDHVFIDGEMIVKNGDVKTIDEKEVYREIHRRSEKLKDD